jgi:imidazolonepropionase-like amidohydrolase
VSVQHALAIRGGTVLAGSELEPIEDAEVSIRAGTIESVGEPHTSAEVPVLDAEGCFVVPGLVDAHVHLDLDSGPDVLEGWRAAPSVRGLVIFRGGLSSLAGGVTSVRDLGSADHATLHYARLVAEGRVVGPRVAACGRMIMRPGGHACEVGRVAGSPADLRAAAREQLRAGARVVKVMASGGFSTPGDVNEAELSVDDLRAVAEEAHGASRPVAAHAHATDAIAFCLDAGIDTIEHGAFLDASQVEEMSARRIPLVPTLRAIDVIDGDSRLDPAVVAKVDAGRARYESSIRQAIAGGVPIAAGTDAGTALNGHGRLVDELERYVGLGMASADALRAATSRAGQLIDARVGAIAPGWAADLLVVEGDPREDLGALRNLRHVVVRGRPLALDWVRATLSQLASPLIERNPTMEGR